MAQERTVVYENNEIHYLLEQKQVKNLNLRVHKDCMVYVSANPDVPAEKVDDFVVSKGAYICSAQRKFREMAQYAPLLTTKSSTFSAGTSGLAET